MLGIEPAATDDELTSHYRRLVENHPDKLIARGMPQELFDIATAKIAAINEAYDEIARNAGCSGCAAGVPDTTLFQETPLLSFCASFSCDRNDAMCLASHH